MDTAAVLAVYRLRLGIPRGLGMTATVSASRSSHMPQTICATPLEASYATAPIAIRMMLHQLVTGVALDSTSGSSSSGNGGSEYRAVQIASELMMKIVPEDSSTITS